jgi:hypothetical protein
MDHRRSMLVALALALALIAGSSPRVVGDGGEYLAQALNFASLRGPAFDPDHIPSIQARIAAADPRLARWHIPSTTVASRDGRRDFDHFWFYALLATPGIWVTRAAGVNPLFAFTLLNLVLLGLALRVSLPRMGPAACLLVFAGPVVWWLDKAHTEAFTFAMVTIAVALARDCPWWSMVAAGAAATQNPPIAALAGLVFVSQAIANRPVLRDRRFWAGALAGLALALIHPLYFYWRYHTPSLLIVAAARTWPSFAMLTAPVLDPDIGLVANYPLFVAAVIVALIAVLRARPRDLASSDVQVAGIAGLVFLFASAQATNVHNGGTPSLSRYALWLVPLAVPFFSRAHAMGRAWWRRGVWILAAASAVACGFVFHPKMEENSREPTALAAYLWTAHPSWNNPLPEVFSEAELRRLDEAWVPVATSGCEKILIAGRGTWTGVWPLPCYPERIPPRCQAPGALCYANLAGRRYEFAEAPGPRDPFKLKREWAWPPASEPHVQQVFNEWNWQELALAGRDGDPVEAGADVERTWTWAGKDRFLIVIVRPGANARLTLRLARPVTGRLIDTATGSTVREVVGDAAEDGRWELPLPSGFEVLLLAIAAR